MKVKELRPVRKFSVGPENSIVLSHCADISLEPNEQVTFVTANGTEYDVVRKAWGYYATPSLNRRLPEHGLRPVLVDSRGARYLLLVEIGKETEFQEYLRSQGMTIVSWLDDAELDARPANE